MIALHVPFTYYPDPCGGTEVYVRSLVSHLRQLGIAGEVAAPGSVDQRYQAYETTVHRFGTTNKLTRQMMYGGGDPTASAAFGRILEECQPDLVHFHAFSPAVSVLCLEECNNRSIPAITTYHTPTQSCIRGTLMRHGNEVCDGHLEVKRCAACFLEGHGMTRTAATCMTLASPITKHLTSLPFFSDGQKAALQIQDLMQLRQSATRKWWAGMKRIIALCEWTKQLLCNNSVPAAKIQLIRHGLPVAVDCKSTNQFSNQTKSNCVKLAFLGRLDTTKGIDLIVSALKSVQGWDVTVDLYVIASATESVEIKQLRQAIRLDSRLKICDPIPSDRVVDTLKCYDALLVPSRWMETGPLVVLEAFAAGIPVVGSKLGGIAEWVEDGVNGLLVERVAADSWADCFNRLRSDESLLDRLKNSVRKPPSFDSVAEKVAEVYQEVLVQR